MPLNKETKLNQMIPLLSYKDGFGIKLPMKVDMPLNKELKLNQNLSIFQQITRYKELRLEVPAGE